MNTIEPPQHPQITGKVSQLETALMYLGMIAGWSAPGAQAEDMRKTAQAAIDAVEAQPGEPTLEQSIAQLAISLRDSKGWTMDYADSIIRDAIDRVPTEEWRPIEEAPMPPIVYEALAATFEQRTGFLTLVSQALRALPPPQGERG